MLRQRCLISGTPVRMFVTQKQCQVMLCQKMFSFMRALTADIVISEVTLFQLGVVDHWQVTFYVVQRDFILVAFSDELYDRVLVLVVDDGKLYLTLWPLRQFGLEGDVEWNRLADVEDDRRGVWLLRPWKCWYMTIIIFVKKLIENKQPKYLCFFI